MDRMTLTLDQAIETVMKLPLEQQLILIDVVRKRQVERRRREMARDAQASLAAFRAGELNPQPAEDIVAELRQALILSESENGDSE